MKKILQFLIILIFAGLFIYYYTISNTSNDRINKLRTENELIIKNNKVLDSVRMTYQSELDSKKLEIDSRIFIKMQIS